MDFKINTPADKAAAKAYIDALPEGKQYCVSVAKGGSRRSISQNRLYWMWLNCISSDTGNDVSTLHHFFAVKFLEVTHSNVFGRDVVMPVSTAELDAERFSRYLDSIQAFASDYGIILPQPSDLYFEAFVDKYETNIKNKT